MVVSERINGKSNLVVSILGIRSGGSFQQREPLGVTFWKKVKNTIYTRSVAYMPEVEVEVEVFLNTLNFQRKCRAIRKMVNNGVYIREIDWLAKQFHA